MPSLADIANVASALEGSPIRIIADNCVAVRNRNASCRECIAACPFDAISIAKNEITFDAISCVGCGACTTVCPTEALLPCEPDDAALSEALDRVMAKADGKAIIACARMAARRVADPACFVEVPCLARIDESVLTELAARQAQSMVLVDGVCTTCKFGKVSDGVDATVAFTEELLKAQGCLLQIARVSEFPAEVVVENAAQLYGSTRRTFFSDAASAAKETTYRAVKATLAQEFGGEKDKPEIGKRLRVGPSGNMPRVHPARHAKVLDALDGIGQSQTETVQTRLFATLSVNPDKCNACGMCVRFCPTGALMRDEAAKPSDPVRVIEFSACDCVQCGMCLDVCWKHAIELSDVVPTSELFDFEPRAFTVDAKERKGTNLFR